MGKFALYLKLIRAWMASGKGITGSTVVSYALQTVSALAHVDLTGPYGQLVVSLVEGFILSNDHHDALGGPVMTPAHAVEMALAAVTDHMETGIGPDKPAPAPSLTPA